MKRFANILAAAALLTLPAMAQKKLVRPQVTRPDGPVWLVIRANCTRCHGIDDYAFHALDKAGWRDLITAKHTNPSVTLADKDWTLLTDWLASQFGPTTKPFPRTYVPPDISTFLSDPEANRLMQRACTKCHGLDKIESERNYQERWRALTVSMRERGAPINDQEMEQLVEWLSRVRGTNQDQ